MKSDQIAVGVLPTSCACSGWQVSAERYMGCSCTWLYIYGFVPKCKIVGVVYNIASVCMVVDAGCLRKDVCT